MGSETTPQYLLRSRLVCDVEHCCESDLWMELLTPEAKNPQHSFVDVFDGLHHIMTQSKMTGLAI